MLLHFFSLFQSLFSFILPLIFTHLLQSIILTLFVLTWFLGLFSQLKDDVFEINFVTILFHISPDYHDGVLKLHSKLSSILLFLIVVEFESTDLKPFKVLLAHRIANDVINCWLSSITVNKPGLMLIESLVKLNIFLSQIFKDVDWQEVNTCIRDHLGISIHVVIHQKRVVVNDTPSMKALDNKLSFNWVFLVHQNRHLNRSALNNVHFAGHVLLFVQVFAFIDIFNFHLEDYLTFYVTGKISKIVDLIKTHLQESLEWILVIDDSRSHHLTQVWIKVKQFKVSDPVDGWTGTIVQTYNGGRSWTPVHHGNLSEMLSRPKNIDSLGLISINKLISDHDFAFTFSDEEHLVFGAIWFH